MVPQLVASLAGALVGALALALVFCAESRQRRRERKEQYKDDLNRAAGDLIGAVWDWAVAYDRWQRAAPFATLPNRDGRPRSPLPIVAPVHSAMMRVRIAASCPIDQGVAVELAGNLHWLVGGLEGRSGDPERVLEEAESVTGWILNWRMGVHDPYGPAERFRLAATRIREAAEARRAGKKDL